MLNYGEREKLRLIISKILALYHIIRRENGDKKMQHNLKTSQVIKDNSGKKIVVDIEYDFEKNCWIIQNNISITTAVEIAKNLKKQYYTNKNWVVGWADLKIKVRFIDEVEHF